VLDTGLFPANTEALRRRIEGGELPGPSIMMASGKLVPQGGSPFYLLPARLPEATSVSAVAAMVEATLDRGAEGINLFTGSSAAPRSIVVMPIELVRAATSIRRRVHDDPTGSGSVKRDTDWPVTCRRDRVKLGRPR
jgi:hypothetical protein